VTTTLDAGVATAAALHLAATLPPPVPACGLATADLLEDTLIEDALVPKDGYLAVPSGPGLGIQVDAPALARWALPGGATHERG
jgi:L-alanine-DL-glutamate epimerase-like enolase superfamily enzyme